jgi:15-cis-phytoene synthase
MSTDVAVPDAYRHCESLTRHAAANFYYGIRLLPRSKRRAVCAVYAFARRVDDIGDGPLEPTEKLRRLDQTSQALDELLSPSSDPVMVALADAHKHFQLPISALGDLIEGVRMDVQGTRYETFDQLLLYCRRVAGSIGLLCLAIFGSRDRQKARRLAEDLGVALQLTNIQRDLREDAENGRAYLPREDFLRFGLLTDGDQRSAPEVVVSLAREADAGEHSPEFDDLIDFQSARASEWFDRSISLVGLLDWRSGSCVLAMAGIYRRLLDQIRARPGQVLCGRMSLTTREKIWVALGSILRINS